MKLPVVKDVVPFGNVTLGPVVIPAVGPVVGLQVSSMVAGDVVAGRDVGVSIAG